MKAILFKGLGLVVLLCAVNILVQAQIDLTKFEIGINANAFIYQGDLTPSNIGSYRTAKPGLGIYFSRIISPSFSLRTNLVFGKLKGDDAKYSFPAWRQQRNFNFKTPVSEISELLVWDIFGTNGNNEILNFSTYLFGGIGLNFLNIKRDWSHFNTQYFVTETDLPARITVDANHSLPRTIPVIPLGIGIRYPVTQRLSVSAETSYRLTFTDYLDGFSQAANPSRNDHYFSHSIGLIYHLGKKNTLNCPVIPN